MKELLYLKKYFIKYKLPLLLGVVFILISNIFSVIIPEFIGKSFDEITNYLNLSNQGNLDMKGFKSLLITYSGVILGAAILKGFFTFLMRQTVNVTSRKIEFDIKNEIYTHYQKLESNFYIKNKTGDIINRISEDVSKVRMFLGPAVMYSINLVIMIALVVWRMYSVSPLLTLYTVIPMPILAFTIYYVSNKINKKSLIVQESLAKISNISQESFAGIRFIKSYGLEDTLFSASKERYENYKNDKVSLIKTQSLFFPLMILLIGISNLTVIYFGGQEAILGNITLGSIPTFLVYVNMLTWPVASIGWVSSITYTAAASQKRINEFLKTKPSIINTAKEKTSILGDIEFKNVHFTYPHSGVKALQGVSFKIKKGETLGIIGKTGSGKTTIAQLICRVFDIQNGEINLNNKEVKDHHLYGLRNHIAYVPQDVFLFSDSVKNNIAFGVENAQKNDIIEAAKMAVVHENIENFKEQYDTKIGERGISLSGGQKQRISLARAMMKQPDLLILDDSLSAVDMETEHQIIANLQKWIKDKTSIIISHRISSVQHADQIIVLDQGKIIEKGTHQELLKLDGHYKEVYQSQQET